MFEILFHGKEFELPRDSDGVLRPAGVWVWRAVDAPDSFSAVDLAAAALRREPELIDEVGEEGLAGATFEADEIRKLDPGQEGQNGGYVFYVDDEEEDDDA